jgi:sugar phosphate isomerase/epimerase
MEPGDFAALCGRVDGLRVTLDVSHVQLALNAATLDPATAPDEVVPVVAFLHRRGALTTLEDFIARVAPLLNHAHISNAHGLFGEGLAYDDGDIDLDAVAQRLAPLTTALVTETLEADVNDAALMRECMARLRRALEAPATAEAWA